MTEDMLQLAQYSRGEGAKKWLRLAEEKRAKKAAAQKKVELEDLMLSEEGDLD